MSQNTLVVPGVTTSNSQDFTGLYLKSRHKQVKFKQLEVEQSTGRLMVHAETMKNERLLVHLHSKYQKNLSQLQRSLSSRVKEISDRHRAESEQLQTGFEIAMRQQREQHQQKLEGLIDRSKKRFMALFKQLNEKNEELKQVKLEVELKIRDSERIAHLELEKKRDNIEQEIEHQVKEQEEQMNIVLVKEEEIRLKAIQDEYERKKQGIDQLLKEQQRKKILSLQKEALKWKKLSQNPELLGEYQPNLQVILEAEIEILPKNNTVTESQQTDRITTQDRKTNTQMKFCNLVTKEIMQSHLDSLQQKNKFELDRIKKAGGIQLNRKSLEVQRLTMQLEKTEKRIEQIKGTIQTVR